MLQYQHSPLVHVATMKSYLCNTSAAINLLTTIVVLKWKSHGASWQQAFCLPNPRKTFQRGKRMDLSKNCSKTLVNKRKSFPWQQKQWWKPCSHVKMQNIKGPACKILNFDSNCNQVIHMFWYSFYMYQRYGYFWNQHLHNTCTSY